ncbi:hypothetical protein BY996DRAFT_8447976 [Phakopsora pachyrhizi]|nr:hypothetical protein BY996DRAFT_8447976 [Phakopsora pachyrhizi]
MWKGKQGSKSSDRAILVSIRHFQRLQNLIQDLGAHVSMNNKITRADSLASVRNFIEQDNHWAAGQEMSRFLDFYGKNRLSQLAEQRNPLPVVATTSLGAYHNSKILQIHLLAIRDWMRRAAFLLAIIKKGKKEKGLGLNLDLKLERIINTTELGEFKHFIL